MAIANITEKSEANASKIMAVGFSVNWDPTYFRILDGHFQSAGGHNKIQGRDKQP